MTLNVVVDGRPIPIAGRAAEMVRWIAVNEGRINDMEQGSVTLNFSGVSLKPEIREVGPAIAVGLSPGEGPRQGLDR